MHLKYLFLLLIFINLISCKSKEKEILNISIDNLESNFEKDLTDILVNDIVSPTVASRIYAYANIAYYEGIRLKDTSAISLINNLKGFKNTLQTINNNDINENIVATTSFFKVSKALCFSKDSVEKKYQQYLSFFKKNTEEKIFLKSVEVGDSIAKIILDRASNDNYKLTRGLPRYSVINSKDNFSWEQTPPDYADATEPNWGLIKPLLLDSASQFAPGAAPIFSNSKTSFFYKEMNEVYNLNTNRTLEMDTIAKFWDDNAYVTQHSGHFVAASKKITPVGHWMSIVSILNKNKKIDNVKSALIYATTAACIFDGFISCWYEKYKSKRARPITTIRKLIDPNWNSFLQTPPFPEYTSGHSVISNAAATLLTTYIGNDVAFLDTSELEYIGLQRNFINIKAAADEASISRLYGGIHYRSGIESGKTQGIQIAEYYLKKIK